MIVCIIGKALIIILLKNLKMSANITNQNGEQALKAAVTEDVRGGRCPLPMLRAKRALAKIDVGETALVIATDPSSHDDFLAMLKHVSHTLVHFSEEECAIEHYGVEYHFYIKKGES